MRLLYLDGDVFKFTDVSYSTPPYAILSHTWAINNSEEVLDQDVLERIVKEKVANKKLIFCAAQAGRDGYQHFWIDTCCIDKHNEPEIAMSIRSMYRWYKEAAVCYVYLDDVEPGDREAIRDCRWLQRGWTLQELIAPKMVKFFAKEEYLGDREDLAGLICSATEIDDGALEGRVSDYPHYVHLQWGDGRNTKVPEDMTYALMGICGISMSARYGEGPEEARRRLESKIMQQFGTIALRMVNGHASDPQEERIGRRERLLKSLQFEVMDIRRDTIRKAWSKTCTWVLDHATYRAWLEAQPEDNGFFWIKGKPGAGKSVLIKFLDNHISSARSPLDVLISFYFNARGEALEKTFAGLYRSLLAKLFIAMPSLKPMLDNARLTALDNSERTLTELRRIFLDTVCKLGRRRLFIFADALDECLNDDVQRMVNYMQELAETAREHGVVVLSCFASRHYPIVDIPTRLHLTLEHVHDHALDLSQYVKSHIRVGTLRQAEMIKRQILDKAQGVFLWVVLVVEILNELFRNGQIHAVQERLRSIPQDLTQLINDIIRRDGDDITDFLRCVKWVYYAKRAITLPEFYFAMMGNSVGFIWRPDELTLDQMHAFMLSSSKGLAEMTKGTPRVQFIHEAVRNYLVASGLLLQHPEQSIADAEAAIHLAMEDCCIRGCQAEPLVMNFRTAMDASDFSLPFSTYALDNVFYHGDLASTGRSLLLRELDLEDWRLKSNLLGGLEKFERDVTIPYICATLDLPRLLGCYQGDIDIVTSGNQKYSTPLFAALARGNREVARILLDRTSAKDCAAILAEVLGDDRSQHFRWINRARIELPWVWAIKAKYHRLARHLVSMATPDEIIEYHDHDDENECAIRLAISNKTGDALRIIVDVSDRHGKAVDGVLQTALMQAVQRNRSDQIEIIMRVRPQLQSATAGVTALRERRTEALQAILETSPTLASWTGIEGETLLHLTQDPQLLRLLLAHCNVNAQRIDGMTPLDVAVHQNVCLRTIWQFLEAGATGTTRLCQLAMRLDLLDFDQVSALPPLFAALSTGDVELVSDLLEAGAQTEVQLAGPCAIPLPAHLAYAGVSYDSLQHSAVSWAAVSTDAMLPLVLKYASPEHEDSNRLRPLHYAAMSLYPHRVAMLLQADASPFHEDKQQRIALDLVEQAEKLIQAKIFPIDDAEQLLVRASACKRLLLGTGTVRPTLAIQRT